MNLIYKITNIINNRFYIGSTKNEYKRFLNHFNLHEVCLNQNNIFHEDILKYGKENFKINILYEIEDDIESSRMEGKLIRQNKDNPLIYNIVPGSSGRKVFYEEDIKFIRYLYSKKELTCLEAYNKYFKEEVTYRAFKKAWFGDSYKNIMHEVYSEENKNWHFSKGQSRPGDKNPNSKFTKEQVIDIRTRKKLGEKKLEVYKDYKYMNSYAGFTKIWKGQSWKNIII